MSNVMNKRMIAAIVSFCDSQFNTLDPNYIGEMPENPFTNCIETLSGISWSLDYLSSEVFEHGKSLGDEKYWDSLKSHANQSKNSHGEVWKIDGPRYKEATRVLSFGHEMILAAKNFDDASQAMKSIKELQKEESVDLTKHKITGLSNLYSLKKHLEDFLRLYSEFKRNTKPESFDMPDPLNFEPNPYDRESFFDRIKIPIELINKVRLEFNRTIAKELNSKSQEH